MKLKRRKFLSMILKTASTGVVLGVPLSARAKRKSFPKFNMNFTFKRKPSQLNAGQSFIPEKGEKLLLPANPKLEDRIYVVVESNSLKRPAKIIFDKHKIAGDHDDLVLDSLASFDLVFKGGEQGWVIS